MAIPAILFGQALAAGQQVPAEAGDGIVQRRLGVQFRRRQVKGIARRIVQAIATLGLADVAGHQREFGGQLFGQFQQRGRFALAQFQLDLGDGLALVAGTHLALVEGDFDDGPGLAPAPGDLRGVADEIGVEHRLQAAQVQVGQFRRPAAVVEQRGVQGGIGQRPFPFVALGQPGQALAATLERLDETLAITPHAQGDLGVGQIAGVGVVIAVGQLVALPAVLATLLQQRMSAQGVEGGRTGAQLDFGFFGHWRILAPEENGPAPCRARHDDGRRERGR